MLSVVGMSHRTAPIEVRERLAIHQGSLPEVLAKMVTEDTIGECVVLSTCNRVEVFTAPRGGRTEPEALGASARDAAKVLAGYGGASTASHLKAAYGQDALRHLFRVASSLDSLVVGEPQILGQLKEAIGVAERAGTLGPSLSRAMHRAIVVGKRVRTETAIGQGQVSVSSVAVDLARQIFGELTGSVALLVGAGDMAEAAARILVKAGVSLRVINRSPERAQKLATEFGGMPRAWGELSSALAESDIVITSTSAAAPVITTETVRMARRARKGRSLFLIDIAVPRDVEAQVNGLDNVYLYDIDDLSQIVAESLSERAAEANRAEALVETELQSFETFALERALTPTIVGLRETIRSAMLTELDKSFKHKLRHLSAADRKSVERMLDAATNRICHGPVTRLKGIASDPRAGEYVSVVRDIFSLPDVEEDGVEPEEAADETRHAAES